MYASHNKCKVSLKFAYSTENLNFAEDMRTKKEILNHIVYVGKQNLPQGGIG